MRNMRRKSRKGREGRGGGAGGREQGKGGSRNGRYVVGMNNKGSQESQYICCMHKNPHYIIHIDLVVYRYGMKWCLVHADRALYFILPP